MCEEWNKSHPTPYPDQIFQELLLRYEEPNSATRWDSPLFTVIYDDKTLPTEEIWSVITNTKTKPNMSTMQRSATDTDSLYELERGTQDVVTFIMQSVQSGGGNVKIPGVEKVQHPSPQQLKCCIVRKLYCGGLGLRVGFGGSSGGGYVT